MKSVNLFLKSMLIIMVTLFFVPSAYASYRSSVYTPNNSRVRVIVVTSEFSPSEIERQNIYWSRAYPQAVLIGDASKKYNCHSYAWYSMEPTNVWINSPNDDIYMNDGSYRQISGPLQKGVRFSYRSGIDHSAVGDDSTYLTSKWGQGPVMRHKPDYCPYVRRSYNYTLYAR